MKPVPGGRIRSTISRSRRRSLSRDAARDADVIDRRHEHQVAAGQRDVAGDARALGADRLLGHLDDDLLPFLEQVLDADLLARLGPVLAAVPLPVRPLGPRSRSRSRSRFRSRPRFAAALAERRGARSLTLVGPATPDPGRLSAMAGAALAAPSTAGWAWAAAPGSWTSTGPAGVDTAQLAAAAAPSGPAPTPRPRSAAASSSGGASAATRASMPPGDVDGSAMSTAASRRRRTTRPPALPRRAGRRASAQGVRVDRRRARSPRRGARAPRSRPAARRLPRRLLDSSGTSGASSCSPSVSSNWARRSPGRRRRR